MRNIKPKLEYTSVSFPKEFINEIKKYIMLDPEYKSIADFVRDAIREKLRSQKEALVTMKEISAIQKQHGKGLFNPPFSNTTRLLEFDDKQIDALDIVINKVLDEREKREKKKD